MSGICGTICFDGRPADPQRTINMAQAARHRGPDGIDYHHQDGYGAAFLRLEISPEAQTEIQPLVSGDGNLILTADARIDNREALLARLSPYEPLLPSASDAQLILAAYLHWGYDCPNHLIGDFAFVIWDQAQQTIFAARDRMGSRPIYFRLNHQEFQWASETTQLLADPSYPIGLNEATIAHDMGAFGHGSLTESYYLGIEKLGPAERLIYANQHLTRDQYWDYDPDYRLDNLSSAEYVARFQVLFRQAVRNLLRTRGSVGFFMSGGLDSTSVTAMAAQILQQEKSGLAEHVQAVSWETERLPEQRESERSRAVAEQWRLPYKEIICDDYWPLADDPAVRPHRDDPFEANPYRLMPLSMAGIPGMVRPRRWVMSTSADLLIGGSNPYYYLSLLKRLQWRQLGQALALHSREYGFPLRETLWTQMGLPLLYPYVHPLRRWLRTADSYLPAWVSPGLAQRTHLGEWLKEMIYQHEQKGRAWGLRSGDPARRQRYEWLKWPTEVRVIEWANRTGARYGMEICSPWSNSDLIAYALAIPQEQHACGLNHKLLLRQAMGDLLPAQVRERRGRRVGALVSLVAALNSPQAKSRLESLLTDPLSAQMDLVNIDVFRQAVSDCQASRPYLKTNLFYYFFLEQWLRAFW
jgi:asparagine synthase (glutamine-hydrolysing)